MEDNHIHQPNHARLGALKELPQGLVFHEIVELLKSSNANGVIMTSGPI